MNGAILGMTRAEVSRKLDEIVDFSGCERYLDTPVKRYSSGMMVRLGFAVAAHLDPEILVVDEVLAVGDAEFQKKAIGKMKDVSQGEGRTVLFVSHNMAAVRMLCKSGVVLNNGSVECIGSINNCIDYYLNERNSFCGESIIPKFRILNNALSISRVLINGKDSDIQVLRYPDRKIDISIEGEYNDCSPLEIECSVYSDKDVLICKRAQSLVTGKYKIIDHSSFHIDDSFCLPIGLSNGVYYLRIDICHPKVTYLAIADHAVRVVVQDHITEQGISVEQRDFGYIIL